MVEGRTDWSGMVNQRDAAAMLGVSVRRLQQLCVELGGHTFGRRYLGGRAIFSRDRLRDFVDQLPEKRHVLSVRKHARPSEDAGGVG